ncbi:uncharacterized protein C4orf51 isoform X3 [Sus scrofa]|nr:uncharacterized protein C4orf51 isoform X3 [Sus scrofa]XP_020957206.1 uncharacterized protein C4orf51 isoform X3 [Sus scrofa]XP_020957207.1 uncharacterized protein C4orf51 isoform X3 [Sus scrofa]
MSLPNYFTCRAALHKTTDIKGLFPPISSPFKNSFDIKHGVAHQILSGDFSPAPPNYERPYGRIKKLTSMDLKKYSRRRRDFLSFRNRVILQARLAHLKTHKRINTPFIVWEGRSRHLAESENEATELEAQSLLNYRL